MKTILRVKTKKEFIQEYGSDWRNKVPYGFIVAMDVALGMPENELKTHSIYGRCSFSKEMFIEAKEERTLIFSKLY